MSMNAVRTLGGISILLLAGMSLAQAPAVKAPPAAPAPAPLQLQTLGQATQADPFPAVDPVNFSSDTPSLTAVDGYLKAMLGYDQARIWRVEGIQKTPAPGVSKVTVLLSERAPNAKVLTAVFYVLPDGKHLLAEGSGVGMFGPDPFAEPAAMLRARADGPSRGAAGKELELVEFTDLQCPYCKNAQPIMAQLEKDFPSAHIVYQNFPLVQEHPLSFKAAAYGVCVAKIGNPAFFTFIQAVYDTQGALTAEAGDRTLAAAVTKAGGDAAAIAKCAASDSTAASVNASLALGHDVGVNATPSLAINGRLFPLSSIPYETLKRIIAYQAGMDGVRGVNAPSLR